MNIRPNQIEQITLEMPLLRSDTPGVAKVLPGRSDRIAWD